MLETQAVDAAGLANGPFQLKGEVLLQIAAGAANTDNRSNV
jgi:hypothetical protein